MSTAKPSPLCNLEANYALGGQKNFVRTFNWLVSCLDKLCYKDKQADGTNKIEGLDQGKPVLECGGLSKITDTDGNSIEGVREIVFESEDDSKVTVKAVEEGSQGVVKLKIGVYYK